MRRIGCAFICVGLAVALLSVDSGSAFGQDYKLKPNFGTKTLRTGFTPDPFFKQVIAGGNKTVIAAGIRMRITEAPDYRIQYTAGDTLPLSFYVRSQADTTLLINMPNGQFIADDDSGGNLNPLITLKRPMSGQYDIWIGTFNNGKTAPATLYVTELPVRTPIPK